MDNLTFFSSYFESHEPRLLERYKTLLSFPTVSAEYESHKDAFSSCTQWLTSWLEAMGFQIECHTRPESPAVIIAQKTSTNPQAPTLTIYNHYDVQPVDPIEEWNTDPFLPFVDEMKRVWARGAQDNKGQLFYVLASMEALCEKYKENFPITIRLLIEGEEESGSEYLSELIPKISKSLQSDYSMIIDMGMETPDTPAITFGARGLVAFTITVQGSQYDLHSGCHGGLAKNPLHALVEMLDSCRDHTTGKITIPGFYEDIEILPEQEMKQLYQLQEKLLQEEYGVPPTGGEFDKTLTERNWLRPTFEINGIHGGYGGKGTKTVIPRDAIAKVTCRLVPNQDPKKIAYLVQKALQERAPKGVTCTVEVHEGMGKAIRKNMSSKLATILSDAMMSVWNKKPDYILSGGSIPVLSLLSDALQGELVLWGVGLSSDHIHAPNEHFDMDRMKRGFITTCLTVEKLT